MSPARKRVTRKSGTPAAVGARARADKTPASESTLIGVARQVRSWSDSVLGMAGAAVWLTIALGLGVILFAVEAFVIPSYLEEWGEMLLGLALVVAPWTVGYEPGVATVSSVLSGLLVILFAVWELMTDRDFSTWWHDRWHHGAS